MKWKIRFINRANISIAKHRLANLNINSIKALTKTKITTIYLKDMNESFEGKAHIPVYAVGRSQQVYSWD